MAVGMQMDERLFGFHEVQYTRKDELDYVI